MKKDYFYLTGALLLLLPQMHAAVIDNGDVRLSIFGSAAPNGFGSASFTGYRDNFLESAKNGFTTMTVGNPADDPEAYTRYQDNGVAPASSITSSSFNSWAGEANPTGAFANEFGQRMHFGVVVESVGTGVSVSLAGMSGSITSSDNTLDFSASFSGSDYTASRVGVSNFGADGVLGGGDDTFVTSGSGSNPMLAILYVGLGNALEAFETDPGQSNQQQLDNVENYVISEGGIAVTGSYTMNYSGGTAGGSIMGSQTINVIPEPSVALLSVIGFIGLLLHRRK